MSYISLNRADIFDLDFEIEKGQTVEPVYITAENENFQDSLVFAEIRRKPYGNQVVSSFTASVTSGSSKISLTYYGDRNTSKAGILSQLDIRVGDEVTVEGSGINSSPVRSVSSSSIEVEDSATRTVGDARLFTSAKIDASFVAGASGNIFTISITDDVLDSNSNRVLTVSNIKNSIPKGTQLIFNDVNNAVSRRLAQDAIAGQTVMTIEGSESIPVNYVSHCGVFTLITTNDITTSSTSIQVDPLLASIPSGHKLYFGYRDEIGWRYAGSLITTAIAVKGATVLNISQVQIEPHLNGLLPRNSIAWFGSFPFDRFYIAMDTRDMLDVLAGTPYGYDVMKWKNGVIQKLGKGRITFSDSYTEVYE